MKEINEGMFSGIIRRSNSNQVKKEDELDVDDRNDLDIFIKLFSERLTLPFGVGYELNLNDFKKYMKNNISFFQHPINLEILKKYVDKNWDKGENIFSIIDKMKNEEIEKMNEGMFSGIIRRSNSDLEKKEDEVLQDEYRKTVELFINLFVEYLTFDEGDMEIDLDEFLDFIDDHSGEKSVLKMGLDIEMFKDFVKENWNEGENIEYDLNGAVEQAYKEYEQDLYECDAVSPNGGLVFGDIQGMGPISFPGNHGEPGSGDLPMPSGKLYRQVAPFDTFIKIRYKKCKKKGKDRKKKFRKEDEPCVHTPNAPVYNYVDDYRDYVDRTYNNMNRMK